MTLGDAPRDKKLVGYLLNAKVRGEEEAAHLRLSGGKAELLNIGIEGLLARRAGRLRKVNAPMAPTKQLTALPTLAMTSGRDVSGAILMKLALRYMT